MGIQNQKVPSQIFENARFLAGTVSLLYEKHSTDVVFKQKKK
jgi:hypothetical protein